ncbi:hypothetical protein FBQ82_04820 [Anaerolineae bacterium CFX7]|nr:hypothetical protein [Anaerolineae bacterium CFX7]
MKKQFPRFIYAFIEEDDGAYTVTYADTFADALPNFDEAGKVAVYKLQEISTVRKTIYVSVDKPKPKPKTKKQ